jgi:hypothetical protein
LKEGMDFLEEVDGGPALEDRGADGPPVRTISRNSPWKATPVAAVGDHHLAPGAADPRVRSGLGARSAYGTRFRAAAVGRARAI